MVNSPGFEDRRVAAIRRRYADPVIRAAAGREIHRRHMAARKRPEVAAALAENLRRARARLNDPEVIAAFLASRPAAGRKRSATVLGWCPAEYRAAYDHLRLTKKYKAAEAKALILAQIQADEAKLSPFDRQMRALEHGRGLVAKPVLNKEYEFTLGGGSPL